MGACDFILFTVIITHFVVVFISCLLQQSLVPLAAVSGTGRSSHVISISLRFSFSGFNSNFGPLVEAKVGEDDDFVVEERAKDQDNKSWNGLPLERFESEGDASSPDKDRPR